MTELFTVLTKATDPTAPQRHRHIFINEFAEQLNWKPSYVLDDFRASDLHASHLIVEHGLEHTSVLSFLHGHPSVRSLSSLETNHLLEASYNNLISNHILIGQDGAACISNLQKFGAKTFLDFSNQGIDSLERSKTSKLFTTGEKDYFLNCDDALIKTISTWKRLLFAELEENISMNQISIIFNSIFFIRAIEDYRELSFGPQRQSFYEYVASAHSDTANIGNLITAYYQLLDPHDNLSEVLDTQQLLDIPEIGHFFATNLIKDFYKGQLAPYKFNFAFMSKHALSRIYERYVTIFADKEPSAQAHFEFAAETKEEHTVPDAGNVYPA